MINEHLNRNSRRILLFPQRIRALIRADEVCEFSSAWYHRSFAIRRASMTELAICRELCSEIS